MKLELRHLPLSLFVLFALKALYLGFNLSETPALLVLALLVAFYELKVQDSKYKKLEARLEEFRKEQEDLLKNISETKNHVASIKMAQNVRSTPGFR